LLVKLDKHNRIQLVWVLGHVGIDRNETADELARQGFSHQLIGPEPVLGISAKFAREVIRGWTSRKYEEHWQSTHGHRQAFLENPLQQELGIC
jgi:Ribonuclease HI